jgi:O-antigen ligase
MSPSGLVERHGWLLAAALALGVPVLFDPQASDGYLVPRTSLLVAGAGLAAIARCWSRAPALGDLRAPALAVAAAAVLACVLSVSVPLSAVGAHERYDGVVVRIAYLGAFAAAAWFARTPRQRRLVVSAFLLGCAAVAVEALWQRVAGHVARPDGTLGQPNLLGALLAMAIVVTVNRARSGRRWLALLPLLAAALVASGSRAAWLGALAGCGLVLATAAPPRWRRPAAAAAALAVAVALGLVLVTPLRSLGNDTGEARLHVWSDTASMIAARPITGWGEDTFGLVFGRFQRGDWEGGKVFDRAHSEPLDLLASQGVLGLTAAAWFWAAWWRRVRRRVQVEEMAGLAGAWAAYAAWAVLNFDWVPATGPLWLLAGVAWAAAREPADEPAVAGTRPPAWAAAALTPVLLAVVVARGALAPAADRLEFGDDHAGAARLDALQAYYHEQAGIAAIDRGDSTEAEAELARAGALGEDDAGSYVELGDVELTLGRPDEARRAYRRAAELNPFYPTARQRLAALDRL